MRGAGHRAGACCLGLAAEVEGGEGGRGGEGRCETEGGRVRMAGEGDFETLWRRADRECLGTTVRDVLPRRLVLSRAICCYAFQYCRVLYAATLSGTDARYGTARRVSYAQLANAFTLSEHATVGEPGDVPFLIYIYIYIISSSSSSSICLRVPYAMFLPGYAMSGPPTPPAYAGSILCPVVSAYPFHTPCPVPA
eukprot:2608816-Rhodomonas_salina.2